MDVWIMSNDQVAYMSYELNYGYEQDILKHGNGTW
jgi:hypothetical protein